MKWTLMCHPVLSDCLLRRESPQYSQAVSPPCSKATVVQHGLKFCSLSPTMVTSILSLFFRAERKQTNNIIFISVPEMHYIDRKAKLMDRHGYYVDTILCRGSKGHSLSKQRKMGKVLHDINQCTNIYHKLEPKDDEDTRDISIHFKVFPCISSIPYCQSDQQSLGQYTKCYHQQSLID